MIALLSHIVEEEGAELLDWSAKPTGHLHEGAMVLVRRDGATHRWWVKFERDDLYGAGVELESVVLLSLRPRLSPAVVGSGTLDGRRYLMTASAPGRLLEDWLAETAEVSWLSIAEWLIGWRRQAARVAQVRKNLGLPYSLLGGSESVLIHGSWDPSNILVDDAGRLSAVLDFEAAGGGQPEDDIASMAVRLGERHIDPAPWIDASLQVGLCGLHVHNEIARRRQLRREAALEVALQISEI